MRQRTFHYSWCNKTETDYVCSHCETVIVDVEAGCQHCKAKAQATALRIEKLKGLQTSIEHSEPGELLLF